MTRFLIFVAILFLASCRSVEGPKNGKAAADNAVAFAEFLSIDGDTVTTFSSWQDKASASEKYRLVPRDCTSILASDPMAIGVPVKGFICMSTTYLPHIKLLGEAESVKGVSGIRFIYDSLYSAMASEGLIADVGAETSPDYEKILYLDCDVVLAYGISGSDNSYIEKLRHLGRKVIVINDYLEPSVMGKLEYIKLFGSLLGKRELADSIFLAKKSEYEASRDLCRSAMEKEGELKTEVLVNLPFKGIWYVPGKASYMAELVADAGGEILGAEEGENLSSQKSFEQMYSLAKNADVWIHLNQACRKSDISSENAMFRQIPAFGKGQLYNNTLRVTADGGSDYWESGALHPDVILKDMIQIFHPEIAEKYFPGRELVYYFRLKD